MTEIKILVNNIHDVTHRAAAETELNVYLKIGWKVHETHQHKDADNASLMLTTIITKEGDETAKTESKQETTKQSEDKNSVLKTDQQNTVKEAKEDKTKAGDKENKDVSTKTSAAKTETKGTKEGVSDEIEQFNPEEKATEKE